VTQERYLCNPQKIILKIDKKSKFGYFTILTFIFWDCKGGTAGSPILLSKVGGSEWLPKH
jgi:hypothetical protein